MPTVPGALRSGRPLQRRVRRWIDLRGAPAPGDFAAFGPGSWIVPPAIVSGADRTSIGSGVIVLEHSRFDVGPDGTLVIGDGCRFGRDVHISCATEVIIEDDVATSDHVAVLDSWGPPPSDGPGPLGSPGDGPVRILRGAYLGSGSVVGPGVRIGRGAYVGEGAVVLDDVPDHALVRGNPAAIVGGR